MRLVVLVAFMLLHLMQIDFAHSAVTEAQLKAAAKLLRKNCQPKTKTSDESIENMHKGIWDDLPSTKCYAFCLLSFYKLIDNKGRIDEEHARSQLELLPVERQEPSRISAENCKNAGADFTGKCEIAYALLKCVYFDNPANYFAP